MPSFPLFIVDAFVHEHLRGNPAAVCLLDRALSDEDYHWIASEMNLSETAFLLPVAENHFELRWFTPVCEVDLCGHATLASAFVLWHFGHCRREQPIQFETKSGLLATRLIQGNSSLQGIEQDVIEMDFPAFEVTEGAVPKGLLEALGVCEAEVYQARWDYLVVVPTLTELLKIQPDFSGLNAVEARGIIVTAKGEGDEIDFHSRFFAPRCGINEDPVTGSAHVILTQFWGRRLAQSEFIALQRSPRGGRLELRHRGERVFLSGRGRCTLQGHFHLPS